ncbi:nitroreductase family protein [Methanosphaerula palustris]|uniref:Nitroreductase n=1 Tax=Methanosphaerula palustris (strain ATCC BAA-1556 / DSM 19958 / E1-9c) TaxID=521011 RepID=B8GJ39_METPE|nr:nitroreductase family protein [Methanosphaerula palustris]ACL15612.1 nitroreductase [Methanosphaerula palustris E1-9c]
MNNETSNDVLDRILLERRTHRRFKQDIPSDEMIVDIIHAGLHAPFAAAAVGNDKDYFRRFFVIRKDSETMAAVIPLIFGEVMRTITDLEDAMAKNQELQVQAAGFMNRLAMMKRMGSVPGVGTAPLTIIAAEKKGIPPVEQQSLAHCMENMWLKATDLGLGFQLVSITAQMADNEEFCKVLGLEIGKWALMGCAIGYPVEELPPSIRPPAEEVITWLK